MAMVRAFYRALVERENQCLRMTTYHMTLLNRPWAGRSIYERSEPVRFTSEILMASRLAHIFYST